MYIPFIRTYNFFQKEKHSLFFKSYYSHAFVNTPYPILTMKILEPNSKLQIWTTGTLSVTRVATTSPGIVREFFCIPCTPRKAFWEIGIFDKSPGILFRKIPFKYFVFCKEVFFYYSVSRHYIFSAFWGMIES